MMLIITAGKPMTKPVSIFQGLFGVGSPMVLLFEVNDR
jgi:hypothetical protein